MTNYEKICAIINAGHIAEVEYEDGKYQLFCSIISDGFLRHSYFFSSPDECYDNLGKDWSGNATLDYLEVKSISVYQRPLWYPKEGELVTILDTIKDSPGYEDLCKSYQEMIGGPFKVKSTYYDICIVYHKTGETFPIDYRHLAPYLGEETKTDDLSKGKEITLAVDGKEYKAIIQ